MTKNVNILVVFATIWLCSTIGSAQNTSMIQPLSPKNGAEVSSAEPLFSWAYAQLSNDYELANYTLTLVEKQTDQSPEIALAANRIVLRQADIKATQWQYSTAMSGSLKPCQAYAWRVEALDPLTRKVVASATPQSFTTPCSAKSTTASATPTENFIVVADAINYPYRVGTVLRLCFDNPYDATTFANIALTDQRGEAVKTAIVPEYVTKEQTEVSTGKNWVRFALPTTLVDAQSYTFSFYLKNGINKTIPFVYFKN